jgi:hypothetical protein
LEHILLRPDTYIGSTERATEEMWIFDAATQSMVFREISFVPGLYKIFDEILVNAGTFVPSPFHSIPCQFLKPVTHRIYATV